MKRHIDVIADVLIDALSKCTPEELAALERGIPIDDDDALAPAVASKPPPRPRARKRSVGQNLFPPTESSHDERGQILGRSPHDTRRLTCCEGRRYDEARRDPPSARRVGALPGRAEPDDVREDRAPRFRAKAARR